MTFTLLTLPEPIARVLTASLIDAQHARAWLRNPQTPVVRKVCLLNVLAVCCVTPTPASPVINRLLAVLAVKDERVYLQAASWLHQYLDDLVRDPTVPMTADLFKPLAVHHALLDAARLPATTPLTSYRAIGTPSLQLVVARGANVDYADADLDLADPGEDVVSLVKHTREVFENLRTGLPTNHLLLASVLALGPAAPYLAYRLDAA